MACWRLGGLFPTSHHDLAGADGLDDLVLGEHGDGGVDFRAVAGDHDDHGSGREIDGLAAEMLGDLERAGAVFRGAEDLDEHHFLGDGIMAGVLEAMDYIDQFSDLLDDLLKAGGVAGDADRHPGKGRVAALGDDEGIDIERAAGEYLADAHEDARLVLDEDGEGVAGGNGSGGHKL